MAHPARFVIPKHITSDEQIDYCLLVIDRYRKELQPLRRKVSDALKWQEYWRNKAQELKEKHNQLQKENNTLKKERDHLKQEIERITKTKDRYRARLFEHGNFKDPQKGKKTKGGQYGHTDTNRETQQDYENYEKKRVYAAHCGKCNTTLSRTSSTQQKILIDIVIYPEIIKQLLLSERQWCGTCKEEVVAKDEKSLPFTEYGINTLMTVILLRFKCRASFGNIATVLSVFGLPISKSVVSNILTQTKHHLKGKYQDLIQAVRNGEIMYNDETGWMIRGERAWMWVMANKDTTIYHASESRGKGNAEELYGISNAYSMHDGYAGYTNAIPENKHLYCWAHMLRYAHEETHKLESDHTAVLFRKELVACYHLKETHTGKELEQAMSKKLDMLITQTPTHNAINNIQRRLKTQRNGLIRALLITPDGTNNLSERDLRGMAIARRISYGSDTFTGMETTAVIGSVVHTIGKQQEQDQFLPTLKSYLQQGLQRSYPQHIHIPYYNTS